MFIDGRRWREIVYLVATSSGLLLTLFFLFLFLGKLSLPFFKRIIDSGHTKPLILNLRL